MEGQETGLERVEEPFDGRREVERRAAERRRAVEGQLVEVRKPEREDKKS